MTRPASHTLRSPGSLACAVLAANLPAQDARKVVDLFPGGSGGPSRIADGYGHTYMSASDGVNGYELWRTDGTAAGTDMVADCREWMAGHLPATPLFGIRRKVPSGRRIQPRSTGGSRRP